MAFTPINGETNMPQTEDTIAVNVVVEMTTASLKAIVENAKRLSDRNEMKKDTTRSIQQTRSAK